MEYIDGYLRVCMRHYAAKQELDKCWRDRLLRIASRKPRPVPRLLAPFYLIKERFLIS